MPLLFICKTHCHFIDKITNHRIIAQRGDLFNFMITSDKSVWRIKTHASLQNTLILRSQRSGVMPLLFICKSQHYEYEEGIIYSITQRGDLFNS